MNQLIFYLCWLILLFCISHSALATIGQNLPVGSAKATALGNAVTADPPGIDAIHFNPAGLAKLPGRQIQIKGVGAMLDMSAQFDATSAYDLQLDFFEFEDRFADRNSEIEGLAILLPGEKLVKMDQAAGGALGGVSYSPPGSRFTYATAVYAPLIGGVYHEDDDPGVFSGRTRAITRLTYFSPSVGYQMTDTFAVGASVGFSYFGVALDMDLRFPNTALLGLGGFSNALCGSNTTTGPCAGELNPVEPLANIDLILDEPFSQTYNLGFLWEAKPWLTIGMVYQSGSSDTLEGGLTISYPEEFANYLEGFRNLTEDTLLELGLDLLRFPESLEQESTVGRLKMDYPAHFATGVSMQLTPKWKLNVDAKWTQWSNWDQLELQFADNSELLEFVGVLLDVVGAERIAGVSDISGESIVLSRGWKDAWNWAMGVEYQMTRQLALRFGYEPRDGAIPADKLDYISPLGDAELFSIGGNYRLSSDSDLDVAIGFLRSKSYIPNGSSTNTNATNLTNFIYNPYAGQDVTTDFSVSLFAVSYQVRF